MEKYMNEKYKNFQKLVDNFSSEFSDLIGKYFCIKHWDKFRKYGLIKDITFYLSSESMTTTVYPMIRIIYENSKGVTKVTRYTINSYSNNFYFFDDKETMSLFVEMEK